MGESKKIEETARGRIIKEATEMFLSQGIKSVRMDDIATQLSMSKRTLYELFSDKQALLEECAKYSFLCKESRLKEKTINAENVIEEIFLSLEAMTKDKREMAFVVNLKKFYPEIHGKVEGDVIQHSIESLDKLFDRGLKEKLFLPDLKKELALMTLFYSMSALAENRIQYELFGNISPQEAFEYTLLNFFRGISTEKGIKIIDQLTIKYRHTNNRNINN